MISLHFLWLYNQIKFAEKDQRCRLQYLLEYWRVGSAIRSFIAISHDMMHYWKYKIYVNDILLYGGAFVPSTDKEKKLNEASSIHIY